MASGHLPRTRPLARRHTAALTGPTASRDGEQLIAVDAEPMPDIAAAPPPLGRLERAVMEVAWDSGELTVRQLMGALNAASGQRKRAYTTILTVMGNLRRKDLLACRRQGRTDLYTPTLSRLDYTEARSRAEVRDLVGRYGEVALAHFAREVDRLDDDRRRRLRELLADG